MRTFFKSFALALGYAAVWVAAGLVTLEYFGKFEVALVVTWLVALYVARVLRLSWMVAALAWVAFVATTLVVAKLGGNWHLGGRNMAAPLTTSAILLSAQRGLVFASPIVLDLLARRFEPRGGGMRKAAAQGRG